MTEETMEIVATTVPSVQESRKDEDPSARLPYDRIVALWHNDDLFGKHIGAKEAVGSTQRRIRMPEVAGLRLMTAFEAFLGGKVVNCHKFGRYMLDMDISLEEPLLDFSSLVPTLDLSEGEAGIIGVSHWGVPHTIGYGMGSESLQVMSSFGEFGFVNNVDLLDFYRKLFPYRDVDIFQVPIE